MLLARPHSSEAITNASVAQVNSVRSPKRRVMKPVSGSAMALLTANEVITHVAWLELAPRLPEMVGNETLAMVVSSTCMNDASARPIVVSARFGGRNAARRGRGRRRHRQPGVLFLLRDGGHGVLRPLSGVPRSAGSA